MSLTVDIKSQPYLHMVAWHQPQLKLGDAETVEAASAECGGSLFITKKSRMEPCRFASIIHSTTFLDSVAFVVV